MGVIYDPLIDPELLLKPKGAAEFLSINIHTLRNWRYQKVGPVFHKLASNQVRYKRLEPIRWIDSRKGHVS